MPSFFKNEGLKLLFFCGKGGVGKTTASAAVALWLAESKPGKKFLLVSTDPAHSLADSFELKIGDKEVSVLKNLFVREFDAKKALDVFKSKYGRAIKLLASRGTYFDTSDVNRFFDLSFPGVDEVMGILEIVNLIDDGRFDTVVVDTAPTGHTLTMLKLPILLDRWMDVFELLGEKHHVMQEHFKGARAEDEADAFIHEIRDKLGRVRQKLSDPAETEFVVVSLPEELVVLETERLLTELFRMKMPVRNIVVNRVAEGKGCPFCAQRELQQRPFIEKLGKKSSYKKILIPLFPSEVRGTEKLRKFGLAIKALHLCKGESEEVEVSTPPQPSPYKGEGVRRLSLKDISNIKLIMVGGKGGVGKTTTSAATVLMLAAMNPERKYRIYSIDPAHSLGDCFGKNIGKNGVSISPNLTAFELDADELYAKFKNDYSAAIDDLFDSLLTGGSSWGVDLGLDRRLIHELMEMSPPGLSELMALKEIIAEMKGDDSVVFDTAPTGHFVRFLELPSLVRRWLNAIFELLLKYKGVVRLGVVAEKLLGLSHDVRAVMDMISDHKRSCALVVTIPEEMAIAETTRLVGALKEDGVFFKGLVVNMVTADSDCAFCRCRAGGEAPRLKETRSISKDVVFVPYLAEGVHGVDELKKFGEMIWK